MRRDRAERPLFASNALGTHGNIVQGAVSFRSHWYGFAAFFRSWAAIERIRASLENQKDNVVSAMLEVQEAYTRRQFPGIRFQTPIKSGTGEWGYQSKTIKRM